MSRYIFHNPTGLYKMILSVSTVCLIGLLLAFYHNIMLYQDTLTLHFIQEMRHITKQISLKTNKTKFHQAYLKDRLKHDFFSIVKPQYATAFLIDNKESVLFTFVKDNIRPTLIKGISEVIYKTRKLDKLIDESEAIVKRFEKKTLEKIDRT